MKRYTSHIKLFTIANAYIKNKSYVHLHLFVVFQGCIWKRGGGGGIAPNQLKLILFNLSRPQFSPVDNST